MSGRTMSRQVSESEATDSLLQVVDVALVLLDEERDVFLSGAYSQIGELSVRKQEMLKVLEVELEGALPTARVINAVRRLIAASRRNEQLIEAARQGLAHARRRIGAIREAGRGIVAYAEDGTRIASKADLLKSERTA